MDFIFYLIIGITIALSVGLALKQKPYWELSREDKKKKLPFLIALLSLVILGFVLFLILALSNG